MVRCHGDKRAILTYYTGRCRGEPRGGRGRAGNEMEQEVGIWWITAELNWLRSFELRTTVYDRQKHNGRKLLCHNEIHSTGALIGTSEESLALAVLVIKTHSSNISSFT